MIARNPDSYVDGTEISGLEPIQKSLSLKTLLEAISLSDFIQSFISSSSSLMERGPQAFKKMVNLLKTIINLYRFKAHINEATEARLSMLMSMFEYEDEIHRGWESLR